VINLNKTIEILNNRKSVRVFSEKDITDDILDSILDAGLHAASGGNLQPFSIIKIKSKENKEWFVEQRMQSFIGKAPVNLLFCIDFNRLEKWAKYHHAPFVMDKSFRHFWISFQDVIIAAQTIETAANSYGIGSVYIGTTIDLIPEIKEKFKLPIGVIPVVLLTMGYPASERPIANKLSKEIVVHNEEYSEQNIDFIEKEYTKKYGEPKTELDEDKLEKILKVIEETDGIDKANETKEYLKNIDKVSTPMRYFGLHYVANYMACDNDELLDILYKDGLIWAKNENHPKKKST
jgi:FMN reductase [NAD(P)H]